MTAEAEKGRGGAGSPSRRRARAVESFRSAAECIGRLEPGASLFAVTRGQFSMIDAIFACLDQIGPARLSVWTWTIAEYEVDALARLRDDGRVTGALLVVDYGARNKNAAILAAWKAANGADSVRYVVNHAKIATLENERWRLLLRGSMNLNHNPRFEQFDLTEGGEDFELVRRLEGELPVLPDNVSGSECFRVSKCGEMPDHVKALELFGSVKVWAK